MTDELSSDGLTARAERLEEAGRLEEALELWEAAARLHPDPVTLCQLGSVAMTLGRWADAERAFTSALKLAPQLPHPYNYLGLLFFEQGELRRAGEYFKESLRLVRTARTLTMLGVTHLELGSTAEARASLREALTIDPSYEEAFYNLALTYRQESPPTAVEMFRKAVELDPEYALAHRELGWTLRLVEDYMGAESHLRRAIELDDSDGWAYIYLGNTRWALADAYSAEQFFKKSVEVWPHSSVPCWCIATFYEYQGRAQEAAEFFERALEIDPDDPEANLGFGMYLKDIGEAPKAKTYLEHALSLDPQDERTKKALSELE